MKSHPVLFNDDMVRAVLAGRKTMTRRPVKPQPPAGNGTERWTWCVFSTEKRDRDTWSLRHVDPDGRHFTGRGRESAIVERVKCPLGVPGDELWVREAHATGIDGCLNGVSYRADHIDPRGDGPAHPMKWIPSILQPRWASRITLTVTSVRVERVQDITEDEARAEGIEDPADEGRDRYADKPNKALCPKCGGCGVHAAVGGNLGVTEVDCNECDTYVKRFRNLWRSIYGADQWDANPWVWTVGFEVKS